jgi:hypothetical protein
MTVGKNDYVGKNDCVGENNVSMEMIVSVKMVVSILCVSLQTFSLRKNVFIQVIGLNCQAALSDFFALQATLIF